MFLNIFLLLYNILRSYQYLSYWAFFCFLFCIKVSNVGNNQSFWSIQSGMDFRICGHRFRISLFTNKIFYIYKKKQPILLTWLISNWYNLILQFNSTELSSILTSFNYIYFNSTYILYLRCYYIQFIKIPLFTTYLLFLVFFICTWNFIFPSWNTFFLPDLFVSISIGILAINSLGLLFFTSVT